MHDLVHSLHYKHQVPCLCLRTMNAQYSLISFQKGKEKSQILISDSGMRGVSADTVSTQEAGPGGWGWGSFRGSEGYLLSLLQSNAAACHCSQHQPDQGHVSLSCTSQSVHMPSCHGGGIGMAAVVDAEASLKKLTQNPVTST